MMEFLTQIRNAILTFGGPVTLEKDGEAFRFTASIQPDGYRRQENWQEGQTRFGRPDGSRYSYYGPLENGGELVEEGTLLRQGNAVYRVEFCHDFCWQGTPVYRWAALNRQEETDGTAFKA